MIGVGVDIVEIERIHRMVRRWGERFAGKVFLDRERAVCDGRARPWIHYSGRFAAKEAVGKALGTGIGVGSGLGWRDVEVITGDGGDAPAIGLSPEGERLFRSRGASRVFVSISHAHEYAVAQAVLLGSAKRQQ